ncbi:hypothetical protein JTE90_007062 [Oedothorax gibbosus]|uniref:50 kDa protein in type i retrotransposable element r1dm n=1 Tax=Oedothorax gibbosus TaxID=931172 RepID=A0AAV6U2A7_9ARAC|nr:hypothetical protein JTE90_007062 [Oedothorax gibbosus]
MKKIYQNRSDSLDAIHKTRLSFLNEAETKTTQQLDEFCKKVEEGGEREFKAVKETILMEDFRNSATYAAVSKAAPKGNFSLLVDLPNGKDDLTFSDFKSVLSKTINNESVCSNGIFETKRSAKVSFPAVQDIDKVKEIFSKTPSLEKLKTFTPKRELHKIIIKFCNINEEKDFKDQLELKNPVFSGKDFKILFKIKTGEQYHWILEVSSNIFKGLGLSPNNDITGFVFLHSSRYRVTEFTSVRRCTKCLDYGHSTGHCPYSGTRCFKCGSEEVEGHDKKNCIMKCFICDRKNKSNDGTLELVPTNHLSGADGFQSTDGNKK